MKSLEAVKCKDGWLCYLKESHIITSEADVIKFAKQNGLEKTTKTKRCIYKKCQCSDDCEHEKEIIKIYAE